MMVPRDIGLAARFPEIALVGGAELQIAQTAAVISG